MHVPPCNQDEFLPEILSFRLPDTAAGLVAADAGDLSTIGDTCRGAPTFTMLRLVGLSHGPITAPFGPAGRLSPARRLTAQLECGASSTADHG